MNVAAPSYEQLAARVAELCVRVEQLERENAALRAENADLRRRLEDKPPPPPPAFAKPSVPPGRKARKPGRPAGHAPALRPPPPQVHAEVAVPLPCGEGGACLCPHCRGELSDLKGHERLVEELIPATPRVTRYRTRSGYCRHCRRRVESRHPQQPPPADLPHAQLGPHALATAAVLKHDAGLPYRGSTELAEVKVCRLLQDLCGLSISPGALPKQLRRLSGWLGDSRQAIADRLRQGPFVHADETGWRVNGVNHWLWALTSPAATLYRVERRRSSEVVGRELGDSFAGHLVSDFLPTYDKLPYKRQKCIPHLLRDLKRTCERSPPFAQTGFCKKLKRCAKDLLRLKARWDSLGDDAYEMKASRLADRLDALARHARCSDDNDVLRLGKRLQRHAGGLAAFLLVKELPGDNNPAERAIRPAVLVRKISGGHRGASTANASAVVMSVLRTIRQQGKHLIDTFKGLFQRHLAGQPCDLFTPAVQ